jgi:hypothetical protein
MADETTPNQTSVSANKVRTLSQEIKRLRGKYEDIKKQVEQKTKYLKYGSTGEVPEKPFYILIKRKSGDWFLFGKYNTEQEYKDAINKIKSEKGKRHSNIADYYVTYSEKEVERFLKVSRYKEKQYHEKIQKEISRLPRNKWSENVREGLKVPEEKTISKEVAQYSGYSGKPSGMMPRMSIGAWGSLSQPLKTNLPSFGSSEKTTRQPTKKQKIILNHESYKEYLDQGYTEQQLSDMGIFSKRSRFYQESSPFGGVVYRPVSLYQSFVKSVPLKSPYQRRMEENLPYELFKPDVVGTLDEFGERKTNFRPKKVIL